MKYCLNYNKHSKYLDKVDELTIVYNKKDTTLLKFLEEYKTKRINIYFGENIEPDSLSIMLEIFKKYPEYKTNIYIKLGFIDKHIINILKDNNIKFFFDMKVNNWDILQGLAAMGVSDIYIVEDLGFELDKVAVMLHSIDVKVRCFPNVAQSSWQDTAALKKFFIRPEDITQYENYIDVIEFYDNEDKEDLLYEIYAIDKKWYGELKEIIIGFKEDFNSRFIVPRFAETRIRCGKKCQKGGNCHMCETVKQLSNILEKAGIEVKMDN
jgi:hypothetical protein